MPAPENITPEGTIPVGFSENDFFYKNVTAPIQIDKPEFKQLCNLSDEELKKALSKYYDDLKIDIPGKQPKIESGQSSDDYFKKFGVTNAGARDYGINDFPKYPDGKQELIDKTFEYYKLVCKNKTLALELQSWLSKNMDGELKLQDATTTYNREYLNRINLGIGIIFTCGLIYYCLLTSSTSILPSIKIPNLKIPEIPKIQTPNVNDTVKK
jgi:hypothetical protein